MKTWFDERRMQMLNDACEQVLSPQVQGTLTFVDIMQLAAYLESHNVESTIKNTVADLANHDVDALSEIAQAIVAETVRMFDSKTIANFTWGAEKEHVLDLSVREDGSETPEYVGDRLAKISEKIKKIIDYFPEDGENFILCTPLMISVLQSANKTTYVNSEGEAFKGPNYTMLVGTLDKTDVYSYLPDYPFGTASDDEDLVLIGNYQKTKDSAVTQRLVVKNLSFA